MANLSIWAALKNPRSITSENYMKLIRRARIIVGVGLVGSIIVFLVLAWLGGISNVVNTILSSNLMLFALAFIAVFLGMAIRFVKWRYYLGVYGLRPVLSKSMAVYFSLYAMDITPAQIGRMLAAYSLSRISKAKTIQVLPVVTMDIFTDSLGFAALTFVTALYFNQYLIYVIAADLVLVLPPFLFFINGWFYRRTKAFMGKHKFFRIFTIYGDEYFAAQSALNRWDVYVVSLLITIPAALLWTSALYFTLASIGVHAPLMQSIFVFSTSQLFGMISTIPGSLGITDGSLVALMQASLGVNAAASYAAAIMVRLSTLWFGIVFGSVFLFYTMKYWRMKRKGSKIS